MILKHFNLKKPDSDKIIEIVKENIKYKQGVASNHVEKGESVLCNCNNCYTNTGGYSHIIIRPKNTLFTRIYDNGSCIMYN